MATVTEQPPATESALPQTVIDALIKIVGEDAVDRAGADADTLANVVYPRSTEQAAQCMAVIGEFEAEIVTPSPGVPPHEASKKPSGSTGLGQSREGGDPAMPENALAHSLGAPQRGNDGNAPAGISESPSAFAGLTAHEFRTFEGELSISNARMTQVESVDPANRVAVVEAGLSAQAINEAIRDVVGDARLRVDENHAGASVLGLEMVLGDGRVVQSGAAPLHDRVGGDLPAMLNSSPQPPGLITRRWCRLTPRPESWRSVHAVFGSVTELCQTARSIFRAGLIPRSMRAIDGPVLGVQEPRESEAKAKKAVAGAGLALPDEGGKDGRQAWGQAWGQAVGEGWGAGVLIELEDMDSVLDSQMRQVCDLCEDHGALSIEPCADPRRAAELRSGWDQAIEAVLNARVSNQGWPGQAESAELGRAEGGERFEPSGIDSQSPLDTRMLEMAVPRSKLAELLNFIAQLTTVDGSRPANRFDAASGRVWTLAPVGASETELDALRQSITDRCVELGGVRLDVEGQAGELFDAATRQTFERIGRALEAEPATSLV